jgi:5'-nucleotidase
MAPRLLSGVAGFVACGVAAFAVTGLASGTMVGCGGGSDVPHVSSACPAGQTCQTRLTILHSSDIHSRLFPYDLEIAQVDSTLGLGNVGDIKNVGGVGRMSYVLSRERARADRVLHLSSGDVFEGAPVFNFFSGEPEMRSQSALGIDAMVIGNHEFDRGAQNVTTQIQRWANFPVLAANYDTYPVTQPNSEIGTVLTPFTVFDQNGLKIAVIGMGNIDTLASSFDQPNTLGFVPLNTHDVAQFYIDLVRPYVDVVIMLTHLGLESDQDMIQNTTGIDVVMGGHNHIVISPSQKLQDCSASPTSPGYIWVPDPRYEYDPSANPPADEPDVTMHPWQIQRVCTPRTVLIQHSGAFAKYVGRLDLVLSNDPTDAAPNHDGKNYEPINGFEVISSEYQAFPIDDTIPDDPVIDDMLQPYQRRLDTVADLDILVGYSPKGSLRNSPEGGDSALGNLIANAMWLRLGVQTDFSFTNTTGIRADLNPGPVTIEEMYNIFPFDNSITKMQLSGFEVQELFDYVARYSAGRSCVSQGQIAGARVRLNCNGCNRPGTNGPCQKDEDCPTGQADDCNLTTHTCQPEACADEIYIGQNSLTCTQDKDCADSDGTVHVGSCYIPANQSSGFCQSSISQTNLYELATSNYLAAGGSGYRVLQRNTTQQDTLIQQRDALTDYLRQGNPCGYSQTYGTEEGLLGCTGDPDCAALGDFVCACGAGHVNEDGAVEGSHTCASKNDCDPSAGRCVARTCRDTVANFHELECTASPDVDGCDSDLNACALAGEECKLLSCIDESVGNFTDNRIFMQGR